MCCKRLHALIVGTQCKAVVVLCNQVHASVAAAFLMGASKRQDGALRVWMLLISIDQLALNATLCDRVGVMLSIVLFQASWSGVR